MKNISFTKVVMLLFAFSTLNQSIFAQKGVSEWLNEVKKTKTFEENESIRPVANSRKDDELKEGLTLQIDQNILKTLWNNPQPAIELSLPLSNGKIIMLELALIQLTTNDFKVSTSNGLGTKKIDEGKHYRGMVRGDETSVVALSVYQNEIRGFVSGKDGNFEVGKTKDGKNEHVCYETKNLNATQPFACGSVAQNPNKSAREDLSKLKVASIEGIGCKTVTVYFECDYQMYLDNGSNVTNVTNYVTSFFNQVATLYQNENIDIQISQIYVWTTADPYRSLTSTSAVLQAFDTNRGSNFTGNLAHFLTTRNLGGGIAYVDVLCNKTYAHGVSMVYNTFATYPTYSWTVECVAHELGHNIGSNHTQWCGWTRSDGTTGPLDNCYSPEGGCTTTGPTPTNGGTVMSYCHLTSTGINFQNGFGTQPGDLIRSRVSNATCLTTTATSAAPTGQATSNIQNTSAALAWNPVTNATVYTVNYKKSSTTTWTTFGSVSGTTLNLTGLASGTSYDWQVKSDCSGFSTTTTFTTTGTASCTAPTGLTSSGITSSSAALAWTAVSGATDYTIQYKLSSATTWTTGATVTGTSSSLSGLTAGATYNWQVKASCSAYSTTASLTTTTSTCAAPTGLTSSSVTSSSANVAWTAVSGATNYTVQYKLSSATTWTTGATVTGTSSSLSGLTAGATYNWQVKASCSVYSTTASLTTTTSTCAAPTGLTSSSVTSSSANVAWTAVSGATNYTVQYKLSSATTWTTGATVTGTSSSLSGLTAGATYNWQVKASCSAYSTTASLTTTTSTCAAPTGLTSSSVTSSSANVAWTAVSGATNYTVQYKLSSATTWTTGATVTGTSSSLSGLTAGATYNWQVKASCSAYSTTASLTTTASTCTAPTGLTSSSVTSSSANLAWTAVSGATNYTVQYKLSTATTWTTGATVTSTSSSLSGLTAGATYNWQVKASCSAYSTTASLTTTASTCAAPTGLTSSSVTSSSANVAWTAVSGATNYTVQYKLSTATTWTTGATVTGTTSSLSGLTAGSTYNWQVKASCSTYSTTASLTTSAASTCNAPTGLVVSNVNNNSATLAWAAVSGATSYTIQYRLSTTTTWTTATTTSNLTYNLTNLSSNKTYNWQVKANCSSYASGSSFSTGSSSCSAPTGLTSTNLTGTSATLSWGAVSGATSYTLQYRKSGTSTWTTASSTLTSTTYSLTALTGSTTYNWQVKANCSGYSSTSTFTTTNGSCSAPTGLVTNQITGNSATLQWSAVTGATNYTLQYKLSTATTWTTVTTTSATSYSLTGLSLSSTYNWQVKANCSSYSTSISFTTLAAIYVSSATCKKPVDLTVTNNSPFSVKASWQPVTGATKYTLQLKRGFSLSWLTVGTYTTNSANINNLAPNMPYQYRVKAECSDYSDAFGFKTNPVFTTSIIENTEKTENSNTLDFSVFPNPSPDLIKIKTENETEIGGDATYRIMDGIGNVKLSKKIGSTEETIDLSNLQEGVYIIQMISKSGKVTTKTLVKE